MFSSGQRTVDEHWSYPGIIWLFWWDNDDALIACKNWNWTVVFSVWVNKTDSRKTFDSTLHFRRFVRFLHLCEYAVYVHFFASMRGTCTVGYATSMLSSKLISFLVLNRTEFNVFFINKNKIQGSKQAHTNVSR